MSYGNKGCDFTNSFQHGKQQYLQQHIEYGHGTSKASAPLYEIYLRNIPLIPYYRGHVPGAKFRYGQTFGTDSIDAKRTFKPFQ